MSLINPGGNPSNTFSSGVFTDVIEERTVGNGVDIEEIKLKDGVVTLGTGSPVNNGDLSYDPTNGVLRTRAGGVTRNLPSGNIAGIKGAIGGLPPVYTSANAITLKAGLRAQDFTGVFNIELSADLALSLAVSGVGGLDAGTEAANTWYYVYLIRRSSNGTVSALFSTVNESVTGSITWPSGYDQKRQLPLAVRNDGSSNIIPFKFGTGWPYRPFIWYNVKQASNVDGSVGPANVLDGGTAPSWTAISLSSIVPPISTMVRLKTEITSSAGATASIRKTGETHDGNRIAIATGGQHGDNTDDWETNASQQIDYITTGTPSNFDINVIGYTVTEIA